MLRCDIKSVLKLSWKIPSIYVWFKITDFPGFSVIFIQNFRCFLIISKISGILATLTFELETFLLKRLSQKQSKVFIFFSFHIKATVSFSKKKV